jgi:hypothetical protein
VPKPTALTPDALSPAASAPTAATLPRAPTRTRPPATEKPMPLQVRWPREEVKAAKLAAVQGDFSTVSDFMLACFHAYMKARR